MQFVLRILEIFWKKKMFQISQWPQINCAWPSKTPIDSWITTCSSRRTPILKDCCLLSRRLTMRSFTESLRRKILPSVRPRPPAHRISLTWTPTSFPPTGIARARRLLSTIMPLFSMIPSKKKERVPWKELFPRTGSTCSLLSRPRGRGRSWLPTSSSTPKSSRNSPTLRRARTNQAKRQCSPWRLKTSSTEREYGSSRLGWGSYSWP